ncbi:MAG: hypothetical protein JW888_06255 [Pirellulales bacterium]|nr:hypothetical protein [Pirellulales bacterium]
MSEGKDWLPSLIRLEEHDGNWDKYVNAVFAIFYRDFIEAQPKFQGKWVRCRRDPIQDGKEAGFWHCVSEGPDEDHRTPDLRRCERIGWVRKVIEHAHDADVDVWTQRKGRDQRIHIWLRESYLVVLGERGRYYQLITAFCTDREHTKRKKRQERDASRNG